MVRGSICTFGSSPPSTTTHTSPIPHPENTKSEPLTDTADSRRIHPALLWYLDGGNPRNPVGRRPWEDVSDPHAKRTANPSMAETHVPASEHPGCQTQMGMSASALGRESMRRARLENCKPDGSLGGEVTAEGWIVSRCIPLSHVPATVCTVPILWPNLG